MDRWSLVVAAGLLSFVAMLDMNVVNLALTDISAGLHVSTGDAQWAAPGDQLPLVALLLPAGRWVDQVGTPRPSCWPSAASRRAARSPLMMTASPPGRLATAAPPSSSPAAAVSPSAPPSPDHPAAPP
ncbi:hypothetical protein ACWCXH_15570 [Kitasatospora sp. NPDC001660]